MCSGIHLSWPSSVVWVSMSDLSTLSSGTSVHPGDRCLTTLWFLGARALRDTGPCRSWDPTYVAPILPVVNDTRGLVGTKDNIQMLKGVSMDMEVGLITKRSDEVEMICSIEELMNYVHQHELVEGDYTGPEYSEIIA